MTKNLALFGNFHLETLGVGSVVNKTKIRQTQFGKSEKQLFERFKISREMKTAEMTLKKNALKDLI